MLNKELETAIIRAQKLAAWRVDEIAEFERRVRNAAIDETIDARNLERITRNHLDELERIHQMIRHNNEILQILTNIKEDIL